MSSEFGGDNLSHQPVLYQQILDFLKPRSAGEYVDGTVGAGGHAWGILQSSSPDGKLLGLDLERKGRAVGLVDFGEPTVVQRHVPIPHVAMAGEIPLM